jgi:hypothetical protein
LVIAGAFDTWSFPEDRDELMRNLVHAPVKQPGTCAGEKERAYPECHVLRAVREAALRVFRGNPQVS